MAKGKFIIYEISTNKYHFSLKACNGQVIAVSQPYPTSRHCERDIALVKQIATVAPIEDLTVPKPILQPFPKFVIYLDEGGLFRFCMKTLEGAPLLLGDGYKAKASCINGIASIRRNAPLAIVCQ